MDKPKAMDSLNTAVSRLEAWAESAEYSARVAMNPADEESNQNMAKNYRALVFLIRESAQALDVILR
jgi:hypothetical protein